MILKDFIKKYKNKRVDVNGKYSKIGIQHQWPFGGQCASLGRRYLIEVCKYPNKAYGNGNQFDKTVLSEKKGAVNIGKNLKKAKDGDILVWDNLGKYGHVAIFYKGKMFSQNPNPANLIPIWNGVTDIIRPLPDYVIKKWNKKQTCTSKYTIKKRYSPNTEAKEYGLWDPNKEIKIQKYCINDGYLWGVYKSTKKDKPTIFVALAEWKNGKVVKSYIKENLISFK